MAFHDRLMSIDRRIIFLSMGLAVALPLLWPLGFPVQVGFDVIGDNDFKHAALSSLIMVAYNRPPASSISFTLAPWRMRRRVSLS